jgi:hypothetical protein
LAIAAIKITASTGSAEPSVHRNWKASRHEIR